MNDKVRLRLTIAYEYDTDPEFYPDGATPEQIAEIERGCDLGPMAMQAATEGTVAIVPVGRTSPQEEIDPAAAAKAEQELMAECMEETRAALIGAGIIDPSVAPMFLAEAVVARMRALQARCDAGDALLQSAQKVEAHLAIYGHDDAGKDGVRRVAQADLKRAIENMQAAAAP